MVVDLVGGLANQMFQYAFGRSVGLARKEEVFFNDGGCGGNRPYGLDVFNIKIQWAEGRTGPMRGEPVFKFDPSVYNEPNGLHYRGCWQTELYFNIPIIREDFTFKKFPSQLAWDLMTRISGKPNVFVHVRRDDYTRDPHLTFHGNLSMDYYNRAIERIKQVEPYADIYVFSDDPDWCQENFDPKCIVVKNTKPYEDLWLMQNCRHGIIANSSFSWFGAWLGDEQAPGRLVIAPKRWFAAPYMHYEDVVPDRWIKLEN